MSQKKLKPGVYFCPETLRMIEVNENGRPYFWCQYSGLPRALLFCDVDWRTIYRHLGEI